MAAWVVRAAESVSNKYGKNFKCGSESRREIFAVAGLRGRQSESVGIGT